MKKIGFVLAASVAIIATSITAYAGQWKQDSTGRWYQNDDGSYPMNQWQEIGGKQYYFNADGYMLINTITPDGHQVGNDGAKIETPSRSQITYTSDSVTRDLVVSDWICGSYGSTYHVFEVTNYSPYTISLYINETAKDHAGNVVGARSTSEDDIPSGCTVFITNYFFDAPSAAEFETTFQTTTDDFYVPVLQNISVETSRGNRKVIVKATNNGTVSAEFPEATAVFFKNGEVSYVNSTYLTDADYEIKPGATITKEINSYEAYDDVKVHLTARRNIYSD